MDSIREKLCKGNMEVIAFIDKFLGHQRDVDKAEVLRLQFAAGYCWYFAHMLQLAFNRGGVFWAAPFGHFVWVDTDGVAYDIQGVYVGEAEAYIPESFLGDCLYDFKHVPGRRANTTGEQIKEVMALHDTLCNRSK